jgi:hypothetical protein
VPFVLAGLVLAMAGAFVYSPTADLGWYGTMGEILAMLAGEAYRERCPCRAVASASRARDTTRFPRTCTLRPRASHVARLSAPFALRPTRAARHVGPDRCAVLMAVASVSRVRVTTRVTTRVTHSHPSPAS